MTGSNWREHAAATSVGSVLNNDNSAQLNLQIWLHAGSTFSGGTSLNTTWGSPANNTMAVGNSSLFSSTSNEFFITGVQLEVGDTATPFDQLLFQETLSACQRYFYNPMSGGNGQPAQTNFIANINMGSTAATTNTGHFAFMVPFPTTMRAIPTLTHNISNSNFSSSGAPSGSEVKFYYQNQGYVSQAGNGNLNTLSRAAHSNSGCIVGTYYISPTSTRYDQFIIGASLQFHFSAEL